MVSSSKQDLARAFYLGMLGLTSTDTHDLDYLENLYFSTYPNGLGGTYAPIAQGFLQGSGAPSNSLGTNGQMYFDVTNAVLYGPKAAGAWSAVVSITSGVSGDCVPQPGYITLSAATRALTAGRIYLVRYCPVVARSITLAGFSVTTFAGSNDPVEIGVYTAGTTFTRAASTGSTTGKLNTTTGAKTVSLSYSFVPGTVYYIALTNATQGSTAATVASSGAASADQFAAFGAAQPSALAGLIDGVLSGGLLPDNITAASVNWNSGLGSFPTLVLRTS